MSGSAKAGTTARLSFFDVPGENRPPESDIDGAHSQFSDGDSYPYCGCMAKVAGKARLAGASLSDGFRRVPMCLRARGPAKTRMLVHVDRLAFPVVPQVTLLCIVCTVRADFSSPYFAVAGLSCNFLEINRSQR